MNQGTVKFFNPKKGFGFITQDNSKTELFFHVTQIVGDIPADGARVQYDIEDTKRGKAAVQVEILN